MQSQQLRERSMWGGQRTPLVELGRDSAFSAAGTLPHGRWEGGERA